MSTIQTNRACFLAALRSGAYLKGPIATDREGRPSDPTASGWCVDGLAYTLFHDETHPQSLLPVRQALGIKPAEFAKWQQVWNDSPLTFRAIADLIQASWECV